MDALVQQDEAFAEAKLFESLLPAFDRETFVADEAGRLITATPDIYKSLGIRKSDIYELNVTDIFDGLNVRECSNLNGRTCRANPKDISKAIQIDLNGRRHMATLNVITIDGEDVAASQNGFYQVYTVKISAETPPARQNGMSQAVGDSIYKAVVDASNEGIFYLLPMHNEDGLITDFLIEDINPRGLEMLHQQDRNPRGKPLSQILPDYTGFGWFNRYCEVMETGITYDEEVPVLMSELKENWIEHLVIKSGEGVIVHIRDLTLQHTYQEELKKSERQYRDLVDIASDVIWETDATGRITYISSAYEAISGRRVQDLLDSILWDQGGTSAFPDGWQVIADAFHARQPYRNISVGEELDNGNVIYWNNNGTPVFSDNGTFLGYRGTSTNITHQVQANQELRQSEQNLTHAQQLAQLGSWEWNIQQDICRWSDQLYTLLGLNRSMTAPSIADLVDCAHPEDKETVVAAFNTLLDPTKGSTEIDYRIVRVDGEARFVHAQANAEFDNNNQPVMVVGSLQDRTDIVAAEAALRFSEERLRDILEASADFIWETGADHRTTVMSLGSSTKASENYVYAIGSAPWENVARKGKSKGFDHMQRFFENREAFRELRTSVRHLDGSSTYWSTSATPAYDTLGNFIGFRGTSRDITEPVLAETKVRKANRMIQAIRDNAPVGLITLDLKGRVESLNHYAERILGFTETEVLGASSALLLADTDANDVIQDFAAYVKTGKSDLVGQGVKELLAKRKDGTEFPIDITLEEMEHADECLFICSFVDTTEQKLMQEQLRQSQRMDAMGQLTGGVAHDFNNILLGMQLNLEFLQSNLSTDPDNRQFVDSVLDSVEKAAELTSQLLSYSRRQVLVPQHVNVNKTLLELSTMVDRTLEESIDIRTDLGQSLDMVELDPRQLENAVLNLCINASHAMRSGGTLTIRSQNQTLTGEDGSAVRYVAVSVEDTGTGISPEVVEKAFEPFFTTKDIGQGSGLGLSMVQGFAVQSGGHVKIQSALGVGTNVTMFFPTDNS
jgi:PAS domain S-box-containing protein